MDKSKDETFLAHIVSILNIIEQLNSYNYSYITNN